MFMNEKKYNTLRGLYYNEINKIKNNGDLNEAEKQLLIKINQRRIELLNKEAQELELYHEMVEGL